MELITPFQIYLFMQIETISRFLFISGTILMGLSAFYSFYFMMEKETFKIWKSIFIPAIIFIILGVFIPDQKQVAAMVIIPKIVNNSSVQEFAGNVGKAGLNSSKAMMIITEKWIQKEMNDNTIKINDLVNFADNTIKKVK